jgi:hypothetical protein
MSSTDPVNLLLVGQLNELWHASQQLSKRIRELLDTVPDGHGDTSMPLR